MVAIAFNVASPARSQLLMLSVSAAPTVSVRTTVTAGVDVALQLRDRPPTAMPIVNPPYVLVEELAVVEETVGVAVWLIEVVRVTWSPLKPSGSVPLVKFKVPVKV
jgi:hypothetical protein